MLKKRQQRPREEKTHTVRRIESRTEHENTLLWRKRKGKENTKNITIKKREKREKSSSSGSWRANNNAVCGGKRVRMIKTMDVAGAGCVAVAQFWQVLSPDPLDYRITKCVWCLVNFILAICVFTLIVADARAYTHTQAGGWMLVRFYCQRTIVFLDAARKQTHSTLSGFTCQHLARLLLFSFRHECRKHAAHRTPSHIDLYSTIYL